MQNPARDLKTDSKKAMDRVGDQAHELEANIVDAGQRAMKVATEYAEEAKATISHYVDSTVVYVKKNPGRSVLGAALLGYFIGMISRRRS